MSSGISPALFSGGSFGSGWGQSKVEPVRDIRRLDIFWEVGAGLVFFPSAKVAIKADLNIIRGLFNVNGNQPNIFLSIRNRATSFSIGLAQKL